MVVTMAPILPFDTVGAVARLRLRARKTSDKLLTGLAAGFAINPSFDYRALAVVAIS
jgi:hypothetical protein